MRWQVNVNTLRIHTQTMCMEDAEKIWINQCFYFGLFRLFKLNVVFYLLCYECKVKM